MVTLFSFNLNSSFTYSTFYFIVINNKLFIFYNNMHKTKVLTFGSKNFNTSLEELKEYLNFDLIAINDKLEKVSLSDSDVLFIHEDYLKSDENSEKYLEKCNNIKILAFNSYKKSLNIFTDKLILPTSIKDINQIVENAIIKKNFNKNSSIKIKDYILDKNEKKLLKANNFILLTEKEIQLLELFLKNTGAITKSKILNEVWKYASEADTHTVETHIYRLRKKIKEKFSDAQFILNDKKGYLL